MLACVESAPVQLPVSSPDPVEHADALAASLDEALQLWRASEHSAAQSVVYRAYKDHFQPFSTELSKRDADASLALEYDFGRLGWQMRRHGRDDEVKVAVESLSAEACAVLSALPDTLDEPAP